MDFRVQTHGTIAAQSSVEQRRRQHAERRARVRKEALGKSHELRSAKPAQLRAALLHQRTRLLGSPSVSPLARSRQASTGTATPSQRSPWL